MYLERKKRHKRKVGVCVYTFVFVSCELDGKRRTIEQEEKKQKRRRKKEEWKDEEFYYRPGECQFEEILRLPAIAHNEENEDDARYRTMKRRRRRASERERTRYS